MDQPLRRMLLAFVVVSAQMPVGMAAASEQASGQDASLAKSLHVALAQDQPSDVMAPLIEQAIRQAGHACEPLRDYQVFRAGSQGQTLKAKCAEQPTYVLTITPHQQLRVSGGDGTIQPINPQDGPITAVWGVRAEKYLAQDAKGAAAQAPAVTVEARRTTTTAGAIPALQTGDDWNPALWAGLLLALLLALPLLIWLNTRPSEAQGFTSRDKDRLLAEAQEILPSIYQHPDGWFIVRGQRGKRRVFRTLLFAYLYRNYGMKLGEVR